MAIKRLATPLESIEYLLEEVEKLKEGGGGGQPEEKNYEIMESRIEFTCEEWEGRTVNIEIIIPMLFDPDKPIEDYFLTLEDLTIDEEITDPVERKRRIREKYGYRPFAGMYQTYSLDSALVWYRGVYISNITENPFLSFYYYFDDVLEGDGEWNILNIEQVLYNERDGEVRNNIFGD